MDQVSHEAHLDLDVPTFGCVHTEMTHDVKNNYACYEDMWPPQHIVWTISSVFVNKNTHKRKGLATLAEKRLRCAAACKTRDTSMITLVVVMTS